MAATPKKRFTDMILRQAVGSYTPYAPMTEEEATRMNTPLHGTGQGIQTGDPAADNFIRSFFSEVPNPIVQALLRAYVTDTPTDEGHPVTGENASRPVVWVVVPFQSTPGDGRTEQRETFITHMKKLHDYLLSKDILLRVRFAEQAFTGFRRNRGEHPIAERPLVGQEGVSTPKFNRGAILNAAINTITNGKCIFTHDVDLVPVKDDETGLNSYDAYATRVKDNEILHLAGGWDRYNTKGTMRFTSYLGGIAGMTPAGWKSVNGYPNDFFGWGGEDDELRNRVRESGSVVNDSFYDPARFRLRDLEDMTLEQKRRSVQTNKNMYNLIKDELVAIHRKKGGLGAGGLNEIGEVSRVISWVPNADYSWVDTVLVAVLPSAYPVIPESAYKTITDEQVFGSKTNASYRALAKYRALMGIGYNWSTGDTTDEMSEYDAIRSRETVYGPGKRADHRSVRGWRQRLKGIRDARGNTDTLLPDGTRSSLHTQLWMDPTGAFSISYPETADTMASILAAMVPTGSSVIDMTACVGGNSSYFSYYFKRVTSIEIAPHRQEILEHNLRLLHPGNEDKVATVKMDDLVMMPAEKRPAVSIVIGDSLEVLTRDSPYKDLARADPLGQVLFLDPPWGGPNYMYLPRPLQLEMVTRDKGGVSAADFLRPIIKRIRDEQQILPSGKGPLSDVHHIGMKVPNEYDIDGLREMLSSFNAVATDPFIIPDRTRKNRVYFIVMTLL